MTITKTAQLPEGICVLVDGGCLNNNLPVMERSMYGSMTVFSNRKQVTSTASMGVRVVKHTWTFERAEEGHASNQLAELMILANGLEYVASLQKRVDDGRKLAVTILSDSEYALGMAQKVMKPGKRAEADTLTAIQAIFGAIDAVQDAGVELKFQHVDNVWVKSVLGH